MAKSKALVISGPVNAKHVSGISVMDGMNPSSINSYFENTALQPDLLPSHTFVASGKTEVARRSNTIASTIRRPSVSLRRRISRLSRRSISHLSELHHRASTEEANMSVTRSDSTDVRRPLRMQSSMSRLRQKVGLDKDLYHPVPAARPASPDPLPKPEIIPSPIQKDFPPLRVKKSFARTISASTHTKAAPTVPAPMSNTQNQLTTAEAQIPIVHRIPSLSRKKGFTLERKSSPQPVPAPPVPTKPLTVRPKRADSGTAIDFTRVPLDERPLGFKEILAVPEYADRMRMYGKAREYWAHADHGLTAWTERASGPRPAMVRG